MPAAKQVFANRSVELHTEEIRKLLGHLGLPGPSAEQTRKLPQHPAIHLAQSYNPLIGKGGGNKVALCTPRTKLCNWEM